MDKPANQFCISHYTLNFSFFERCVWSIQDCFGELLTVSGAAWRTYRADLVRIPQSDEQREKTESG